LGTPWYGVNADGLNMMLDELCENLNLQFIDHNHHFYDRNGSVNNHLFHADGIHLTNKGTSAFYLIRYKLSNKLCVGIEILRLDSCKAFSSLTLS
jgi:lysophospholipase L1-like esterase